MAARIRERFEQDVLPSLQKQLELTNRNAVPRLVKIVVNMGVGAATQNIKLIDGAAEELSAIAGQKPIVTRAKKSIAAFKVRAGQPIGVKVTLRGERMWEFYDRLVSIVLPRVRDFKGMPTNAFDGMGNYTIGLRDQMVFPEVDYTKVDQIKGMNITFVTSAKTDDAAKALLEGLGFPFFRRQ